MYVDRFLIDMTEVTNAHYDNCVRAGFCEPTYGDGECYIMDERDRPGRAVVLAEFKAPNRPVVCVRHEDAANYCKWVGKRLPTEAEWEKAARGPGQSDGIPPQTAHFASPMQAGTVLVDTLEPNGYELRHMHGNVWEWTSDWFDALYYAKSPRMNPTGPDDGYRKIVRGGSWYNPSYYAHAGMRFRLKPNVRLFSLGLRCARTP